MYVTTSLDSPVVYISQRVNGKMSCTWPLSWPASNRTSRVVANMRQERFQPSALSRTGGSESTSVKIRVNNVPSTKTGNDFRISAERIVSSPPKTRTHAAGLDQYGF